MNTLLECEVVPERNGGLFGSIFKLWACAAGDVLQRLPPLVLTTTSQNRMLPRKNGQQPFSHPISNLEYI